jgi:hypothetical protein
VRRRARRNRARESDEQLLATAAATDPDASAAARTVENALDSTVPNRDLPAVAAAIGRVEQALVSRPPLRKP